MSFFFGGGEKNDPAAVKRRTGYQAPGTVLGPGPANTGTAVPRPTTPPATSVIGGPTPPDASLAAQQAATAAQAAAAKARKKASAGSPSTVLTGRPGATTPRPAMYARSLMGA